MRLPLFLLLFLWQQQKPDPAATPVPAVPPAAEERVELNLLGKADAASGESRRNENIQFNLVDNNALKELNIRLGATATLIESFLPARGYFGAEFGNAPVSPIHISAPKRRPFHGDAHWTHQNSIFSARAFFQVGDVQPARENEYGVRTGFNINPKTYFQLDGSQQKLRGQVNGNVLVPMPSERTALSRDPSVNALITRWLQSYPTELPNRTDINPRALNTNSPQSINSDSAGALLDRTVTARARLLAQYQYLNQDVRAFQLVAGQNPDTTTKSHRARLTWLQQQSASTVWEASMGFDRLRSNLRPEPNAIGPMVSVTGLETLGPQAIIPINRTQNLYRWSGQVRQTRGTHQLTLGVGLLRRELNGFETDAHRGFYGFGNDFGRDAITNFRLGFATQYIVSIGDVYRRFRTWEWQAWAGDVWKVTSRTTLNYGIRYQTLSTPTETQGLNTVPFACDCNNVAPIAGIAHRLPSLWGVLRAAGGVHFGEIFPVTWQQVRFSPPGSVKIMVPAPDLLNPIGAVPEDAKGNLYLLDAALRSPYEYQYNASWEPELSQNWRLQIGYLGSRMHGLFSMWYLNRGLVVPGIPQTTATLNQRRPDPRYADIRYVLNGSRGYYDAARVTLIVPRWRWLTTEVSYWFSKAMDLGSAYTNTAYDADSRKGRSQSMFDTHQDMKALSDFDQPHAFLWRASVDVPLRAGTWNRLWPGWNVSGVTLLKKGTPFTVGSGSDGPGYGNVDGNGGDRPNLVDPTILGRTLNDPDTSRALLPRSSFRFMAPTDLAGNLGRNTFRKGGIRNVNASFSRNFTVGGDRRLTVRGESINLLNTPQFAEPAFDLANPAFGQITNTLNDGRTFRFTLGFGW